MPAGQNTLDGVLLQTALTPLNSVKIVPYPGPTTDITFKSRYKQKSKPRDDPLEWQCLRNQPQTQELPLGPLQWLQTKLGGRTVAHNGRVSRFIKSKKQILSKQNQSPKAVRLSK